MTHWKALVPPKSPWLGAADFDGNHGATGRIATVTQQAVEQEDETTETWGIIEIESVNDPTMKLKPWKVNSINCQMLAAMWGDDYEQWVGHVVTLHVAPCEVKGQFYGQPCVRVKGSPELARQQQVQVKLPRRAPIRKVLVPTGQQGGAAQSTGEQATMDDAFGNGAAQ